MKTKKNEEAPEKSVELAYTELSKRYDLPNYKEINQVFEIEQIESTSFLLREVLRTMYDYLDRFIKILEEVLQADSHIAGLFESEHTTEAHKKAWYDLYKKLMYLQRKGIATLASSLEEQEAENIKAVWAVWLEARKEFIQLGEFLAEAWNSAETDQEQLRYMG